MPDDEIKEELEEEQVEEKAEDKVEEEEEFLSPGVSGPSKGILDKITSVFKKAEPEDDNTEETEETEEVEDEETSEESEDKGETEEKVEYEEIDPKFIETAKKYGWDNDRIVIYAENHSDEDLLLMSNLMLDNIQKTVSKSSEEVDEDKGVLDDEIYKLAGDDPKLKAILEQAISPLAKRLNDLSSNSNKVREELEEREKDDKLQAELRNMEVANSIFDKSGISSLGKTDNIPRLPDGSYVTSDPVFKERSRMWDITQAFYANGGTFKQAVDNAIQWYKGGAAEKDVKKKVIKDLKEQEERVMPKRSESKVEKTYANEEERKAAIIKDAVAKYDVELH